MEPDQRTALHELIGTRMNLEQTSREHTTATDNRNQAIIKAAAIGIPLRRIALHAHVSHQYIDRLRENTTPSV